MRSLLSKCQLQMAPHEQFLSAAPGPQRKKNDMNEYYATFAIVVGVAQDKNHISFLACGG